MHERLEKHEHLRTLAANLPHLRDILSDPVRRGALRRAIENREVRCTVLCCAVLFAVLCCAVLCCAVLYVTLRWLYVVLCAVRHTRNPGILTILTESVGTPSPN